MNKREAAILEKCIALMGEGTSLADCINQFPDITPEILNLLQTADLLMRQGQLQVPLESMNQDLAQLLAMANQLGANETQFKPASHDNSWLQEIRQIFGTIFRKPAFSRLVLAVGITVVLIGFSGGLVITSAKSLPGDSLYPVKRAVEEIRVYLEPNQQYKLSVEENYNLERVGEVTQLLDLKRIQQISFEGVVEQADPTDWVVSGIAVSIQPETTFVGSLKGSESFPIGSLVEVEGITNSTGGVKATEIHLRESSLTGIVEQIEPTSWQVSGIMLPLNNHTKIENGIHVGDEVTVVVRSNDNGLYAISIQSQGRKFSNPTAEPSDLDTPDQEGDATQIHERETEELEPTIYSGTDESRDQEVSQTPSDTDQEDEHQPSATIQPTQGDEHPQEGTASPEFHSTPEPGETHEP